MSAAGSRKSGDRDWKELFAQTPPPPPLPTRTAGPSPVRAVPPLPDGPQDEADRDAEALAGERSSGGEDLQQEPTIGEASDAPAAAGPKGEPSGSDPAVERPARRSKAAKAKPAAKARTEPSAAARATGTAAERRQAEADAVLAALAGNGIEATVSKIHGRLGALNFDVVLADPEQQGKALLLSDALALELDMHSVTIKTLPKPGQINVEARTHAPGRQMAVWVPAELRTALQAEQSRIAARDATEPAPTVTELFLTAFNRQYANLPSMFIRRDLVPGPMPQRETRRRRAIGSAVQLWLYLGPTETDVLDNAVDEFGAGSRSALVTQILAADLSAADAEK